MMAAMMAPTAWPWVRAFHRFSSGEGGARSRRQRGSRRAICWRGSATRLARLSCNAHCNEWRSCKRPAMSSSHTSAAVIFLIAGLYQFAPLKRACLAHCRTPFGYFLTRWHDGPMGAFRMGLHHGLFCVGCCWALMATAFAVGVMNAWWMAALGVLALGEAGRAERSGATARAGSRVPCDPVSGGWRAPLGTGSAQRRQCAIQPAAVSTTPCSRTDRTLKARRHVRLRG